MPDERARSGSLVDILLLGVAFVWGINFVLIKIVLAELAPLPVVLFRFSCMSVIGLIVLWVSERNLYIARRDLPRLVLSGLLAYTLYQGLYVYGLDATTAVSTTLFLATVPVFSAIYLAILGLERVGWRQWLGILAAFAGVAVFVADRGHLALGGPSWGDALNLVASAAFALYGIVNKPLLARYSPTKIMGFGLIIGTVPMIPLALPAALQQPWGAVTADVWVILAYSVVVPVYVAYTIWNWGIRQKGVAYTSLFVYLTPILGAAFAWVVLGERFGPLGALGALICLAGTFFARSSGPPAGTRAAPGPIAREPS